MSKISAAASLVPAGVLIASAAGLGSFYGSASFVGLAGLSFLVLGLAAAAGASWVDPLRVGRIGNIVLLLLLATVVASWLASPVPRAGRTALLLVPAFLLLPAAFARCWKRKESLQRGLLGISAAVLLIALWAVLDRWLGGSARAAMPLGHHRLLASWLVCLLPLACLGARRSGISRVLGISAGLVGSAAVLLSGSLLGAIALGVELIALAAVLWRGRPKAHRRWIAVVVAVLLLGAALPNLGRVRDLVRFQDSSLMARNVYWQAGLTGVTERPWLGWGPGSTPWTLASFLRPKPGLNPAGELVGDLHSLPLSLAYELGLPSLLLMICLAGIFCWRRRAEAKREAQGETQGETLSAALIGLTGFAASSLGGAPLGVAALPVALAVVVGAALAGTGEVALDRRRLWWVPPAYAALTLVFLVAPVRAHHAYEQARSGAGSDALLAAVRLDPGFPLYQARLASAEGDLLRAWKAASATPGVAGHWLLAGALATDTQRSIAGGFLGEACRLDPLGAAAPFLRLQAEPGASNAPEWGARAVLADPRLLASPWWRDRGDLLNRTVDVIQRLDGVEAGWRVSLQEAARAVAEYLEGPGSDESDWVRLAVVADSRSGVSFSLHLFRRLPWPQELVVFELDPGALKLVSMPAATILPSTAPELFFASGCGLGKNYRPPGS